MQQWKQALRGWMQARRARRVTYAWARERVHRGAAYLDDVDPGWHRRVHAGTLELASGRSCVLGQLHGDFRVGLLRARLLDLSSAPRASLSPATFGFRCVAGVAGHVQARDYHLLNRAWRAAIRRRQCRDRPAQRPPAPAGVSFAPSRAHRTAARAASAQR